MSIMTSLPDRVVSPLPISEDRMTTRGTIRSKLGPPAASADPVIHPVLKKDTIRELVVTRIINTFIDT